LAKIRKGFKWTVYRKICLVLLAPFLNYNLLERLYFTIGVTLMLKICRNFLKNEWKLIHHARNPDQIPLAAVLCKQFGLFPLAAAIGFFSPEQ
jgi:hypothetical protein